MVFKWNSKSTKLKKLSLHRDKKEKTDEQRNIEIHCCFTPQMPVIIRPGKAETKSWEPIPGGYQYQGSNYLSYHLLTPSIFIGRKWELTARAEYQIQEF